MSALQVMRLPHRLVARGRKELHARQLGRQLVLSERPDLVSFGTDYGGWTIPATLDERSVVYLAGVGKDITFDLSVMARFGCTVHAFDPVPESIDFARTATRAEPRFVIHPTGLWSTDGTLEFYDHRQPGFVSHSATNMHRTDRYLEAPVRAIDSIMRELGHDHIDLLKLSVEGAEYELVSDLLAKQIAVRVLCVEFAQPAPLAPIEDSIRALSDAGFALVATALPMSSSWVSLPRAWNWKFTFARDLSAPSPGGRAAD